MAKMSEIGFIQKLRCGWGTVLPYSNSFPFALERCGLSKNHEYQPSTNWRNCYAEHFYNEILYYLSPIRSKSRKKKIERKKKWTKLSAG